MLEDYGIGNFIDDKNKLIRIAKSIDSIIFSDNYSIDLDMSLSSIKHKKIGVKETGKDVSMSSIGTDIRSINRSMLRSCK